MATGAITELFLVDKAFPRLLNAGRARILAAVIVSIPLIALIDSRFTNVSLGGLYMFPMLLAATIFRPRDILLLAVLCAMLRCVLDDSHYLYQYAIRFVSSYTAYVFTGLFVVAVTRNRQMALEHVAQITQEQRLRNEAQERLKTLVESSPAAILTVNHDGIVLAANRAADAMFMSPSGALEGKCIYPHLPMLSDALRLGTAGKPFRTSAQTQGRREGGEIFLADLWFSTYPTTHGTQLAAIVVDSSEELRDREQENQRQLTTNSGLVVSAVLHEIRNLCSAISVVYSNLKEKDAPCRVDEIQGLETLVRGLGRVASLELRKQHQAVDGLHLNEVLDELRIIIEPAWAEIGGFVLWNSPKEPVRVLADRYGLLQVFLNLAQNSHRAVQKASTKQLTVTGLEQTERVSIVFHDTGPGVANPHHLFQPFQQDAEVTGLGLFVSRVLVRSYGGELRHQSSDRGCCFIVELPLAGSLQR